MGFDKLLNWLNASHNEWVWVAGVFVVIFAALMLDFVQRVVLKRLIAKALHTKILWDDAILKAALKPLTALIWLLGISFAAGIVHRHTEAVIFESIPIIRKVGVITVITWFALRFIRQVEANIVERKAEQGKAADRTTIEAIGKLLRVSVVITSTLMVLQLLGFSITGVLAFGGIGGAAVGFAAKDMLANFFGGLTIYLDQPFAVGDWIRSPDRDIEGTVEYIGWRRTQIRTFDLRPIYVPNAVFTTIVVENPSRMQNRRIFETIGLRYDDINAVGKILDDVREMLGAHAGIDQNRTLMVFFDKFDQSSLNFFVYAFTRTTVWAEYHAQKQDVLLKIAEIVSRHGAEIAFPTTTVHVPDPLVIKDAARRDSATGD